MKKCTFAFLFIICQISLAQAFEIYNKDSINALDTDGKRQGFWIIFNKMRNLPCYKADQKVEEGRYIDGKKAGKWKEFYCNGSLKSAIVFDNNRPNGYAIMYNENGKIREEGYWKNNRWAGDYKLYYENGQVAQELKFGDMGKREGFQKYFHENGQVMIEGDWSDGKEAGVIKEYYENGEIKAEKNFTDGVIDPVASKTYKPKQPLTKNEVKIPVEDAPKLLTTVTKPDEKPNMPNQVFTGEGVWKLYNKNNQISKDGVFKNDRLMDGKIYHYTENGMLVRIAVYKEGLYIGDSVIEE